jgi:hypothetical protein
VSSSDKPKPLLEGVGRWGGIGNQKRGGNGRGRCRDSVREAKRRHMGGGEREMESVEEEGPGGTSAETEKGEVKSQKWDCAGVGRDGWKDK